MIEKDGKVISYKIYLVDGQVYYTKTLDEYEQIKAIINGESDSKWFKAKVGRYINFDYVVEVEVWERELPSYGA